MPDLFSMKGMIALQGYQQLYEKSIISKTQETPSKNALEIVWLYFDYQEENSMQARDEEKDSRYKMLFWQGVVVIA